MGFHSFTFVLWNAYLKKKSFTATYIFKVKSRNTHYACSNNYWSQQVTKYNSNVIFNKTDVLCNIQDSVQKLACDTTIKETKTFIFKSWTLVRVRKAELCCQTMAIVCIQLLYIAIQELCDDLEMRQLHPILLKLSTMDIPPPNNFQHSALKNKCIRILL